MVSKTLHSANYRRRGTVSVLAATLVAALNFGLVGCSGLVSGNSPGGGTPPPLSISGTTTSNITATGAAVSWQTNVPATSEVEFGTSTAYGSTTTIDPTMVTNHQQSLSNLNANTTYHFRVHSQDASSNAVVSNDMTFATTNSADTTAPTVSMSAPANGASLSGTVTVSANASDNVGVASVQFQLDGANLGNLDTASPYSVSWSTTSASNGAHTLRAIAKDAAGNSTASAGISVTVNNTTSDTTPPSVPTALTATAASSSQINLAWTGSSDNVGVAGYKIFRGGTQIATSTATSFANTGLTASTSYTYTVAAYDAAGNTSVQSAGATATTLAAVPHSAGLSWFASTSVVSGYNVYRSTASGGPYTKLNSSVLVGLSYTDPTVQAGQTYFFVVTSQDAASIESDFSNEVSATIPTP